MSRLDELNQTIRSRTSVLHYAHSAISMLVALIIAGAAGKMAWDYTFEEMPWTYAVIALSASLFLYSAVRYFVGRRAMVTELKLFEELKALRTSLGYDQPASMLPQ